MIEECMEKRDRLRRWMKERQLDGVLLRNRNHFSWLTGGRDNHIVNAQEAGVADLLIFHDRMVVVTPKSEARRIQEEELAAFGDAFEFVIPGWHEDKNAEIARLCSGKTMGADVPVDGMTFVEPELAPLRYQLNEEEIRRYRDLSYKTALAIERTCRYIRPGMTEFEIASFLAGDVIRQGLNPAVYLVSTDDRVFDYRHPIPTSKVLDSYAMLVICAEKGGLIANATRFVHFGPLSDDMKEREHTNATILAEMMHRTQPGVPLKDVFHTAVKAYEEAGYPDDWRYLHMGGMTGYKGREVIATPETEEKAALHQAYAWNPAFRGVKMENTFLLTEDGAKILTHTNDWPYIEVEKEGVVYTFPKILVRHDR